MKGKRVRRKNGFTLIEIIVVLIIVGILASIGLPEFIFKCGLEPFSRRSGRLSTYKSQTEGCVQSHYGTAGTSCTWAELGLAASSGNFNYTFTTAPSNSSYVYAIKATNNTYT